jgi:hypothetical protein
MDLMNWRKSSYSGANGAECIETASTPDAILVRDSKNPDGPRLTFGRETWEAFAEQLKSRLYREHPPTPALATESGGVQFPSRVRLRDWRRHWRPEKSPAPWLGNSRAGKKRTLPRSPVMPSHSRRYPGSCLGRMPVSVMEFVQQLMPGT